MRGVGQPVPPPFHPAVPSVPEVAAILAEKGLTLQRAAPARGALHLRPVMPAAYQAPAPVTVPVAVPVAAAAAPSPLKKRCASFDECACSFGSPASCTGPSPSSPCPASQSDASSCVGSYEEVECARVAKRVCGSSFGAGAAGVGSPVAVSCPRDDLDGLLFGAAASGDDDFLQSLFGGGCAAGASSFEDDMFPFAAEQEGGACALGAAAAAAAAAGVPAVAACAHPSGVGMVELELPTLHSLLGAPQALGNFSWFLTAC